MILLAKAKLIVYIHECTSDDLYEG